MDDSCWCWLDVWTTTYAVPSWPSTSFHVGTFSWSQHLVTSQSVARSCGASEKVLLLHCLTAVPAEFSFSVLVQIGEHALDLLPLVVQLLPHVLVPSIPHLAVCNESKELLKIADWPTCSTNLHLSRSRFTTRSEASVTQFCVVLWQSFSLRSVVLIFKISRIDLGNGS